MRIQFWNMSIVIHMKICITSINTHMVWISTVYIIRIYICIR